MSLRIHILAIGALKTGPLFSLYHDYLKRLSWSVQVSECRDNRDLIKKINPKQRLWILDEMGTSQGSVPFAKDIQFLLDDGVRDLQFVIGGADGLPDEVRKSADKLMSFGKQTWPHLMVRVMLMEQLYRAQQILKGHPYHRE